MHTTDIAVDTAAVEAKVKQMYADVALRPDGQYHFEMGRPLAERLGYPSAALDAVPAEATASFAGVGYYFDLAQLATGEAVVDLGSGSGMDVFVAANAVGPEGSVVGVDMTAEQLAKSERLRAAAGFDQVRFVDSHIEQIPLPDASADVVISNGVINLSPAKARVFAEAFRVLRPGGRLAIADIVTEKHLSTQITCNADLWAACIGGAAQVNDYEGAAETAGFVIDLMRKNNYQFLSRSAQGATDSYGVMSVSMLCHKPE